MFSQNDRNRLRPLYFSREWADQTYGRYEVRTALTEIKDYIVICTEYPPHSEVFHALDYLEGKDSKTYQAARNFRKAIYCPDHHLRRTGLARFYEIMRRQLGE